MTVEGFYDEPMLYDVLHSPGTADEVRALVHIAKGFDLKPKGPWLEPACGSGRYVRAAVARGIRIAAFDASEPMVAYARDRMRGIKASMYALGVMRMESFDADELAPGWRFAFAFNLINTIRHLETDAQLLGHLDRVHSALHPGGLYAIGLSVSMYGAEQPSEDIWEASRGTLSIQQVVQFTPAMASRDRGEQVHSVLHVKRPTGTRTLPSSYTLRSYDVTQWRNIIDRSPFTLAGCVDDDGRKIDEPTLGYAIWLLQRKD
ncbi:MAG: class I SAM-dependent methyltransferase [Phycisphaerales bacterium]